MKYILLLFISLNICAETVLFKGYEYTVKSGNIKMAFDPAERATFYECRMCLVDGDVPTCYESFRVFDTICEFTFKRAGHFVLQVRSGLFDTVSNQELFSVDWATTEDSKYATVDGLPQAFRVYFKLPKPEVEIE